jgi:phosphoribosylaminoimidazolecarboxamide formyltransferase/IMP cyclohydrolase
MSTAPQRRAFLSVFDKTGLEPLARALSEQYGYELLATGGTKTFLEEKGLAVRESSEITGFGELLGGRVKSLHPEIFAAILAERDNPQHTVPFLIDVVVVNLYPFEQERASEAAQRDPGHLIHFIDIGGSALIRAAAKNCRDVSVLCDPAQYDAFLADLAAHQGHSSKTLRQQLALAAFQRSVAYDTAIAGYFAQLTQDAPAEAELADTLPLTLQKVQDLRYGENPHQKAALYGLGTRSVDFEVLWGKELSFNNILDMEAGWNIVTEFTEGLFKDTAACAIIKHNNPCGVAISHRSVQDAYQTAFDADPLSAFGGVVAFNRPVDVETAKWMKEVFLEVILAPDFEPGAFELLQAKKNLRLVKRPLPPAHPAEGLQLKQVSPQLFLAQMLDPAQNPDIATRMQVATEKKPDETMLEDMLFAWKVVKHVKSNAIVLAKEGRTVGIGGGQTSRIGALENALKQACDEAKDAILASDGFFPHEDNIYAAVQARVGAIIQPGGSIKDKDIIALANQYQLPMVLTGLREFKH